MVHIGNQLELTGIILTGGRSTRFGFNKLEVKIGKVPLFIDQIFKLGFFCREILLITSSRNRHFILKELEKIEYYRKFYRSVDFNIPEISVMEDDEIEAEKYDIKETRVSRGPIIGLYTGLKNAENLYSIVLAFDMPFISEKALNLLISTLRDRNGKHQQSGIADTGKEPYDAVIIKTAKGYEVLCGLYSKKCVNAFKENIITGNFKISDAFNILNIKIISESLLLKKGIDDLNFFNINNTHDYYKFTDIWNSSFSGSDFTEKWKKFFTGDHLFFSDSVLN